MTRLRAGLRAFAGCRRGGFAVWVAALVPGISVLAIGAVELGKVSGDRARLQDVADAAALAGAQQLAVGTTGAAERARATALAALQDVASQSNSLVVDAQLDANNAIVVTITANRTSFFGNMLPPGGFVTRAQAAASGMTQEPMCVIGLSGENGANVDIRDSSRVTADCMVHSNKDMLVGPAARLVATAAQAAGVATGPITPAGRSGAAPVADPFANRAITIPACAGPMEEYVVSYGTYQLQPGVHCGDYELTGTAVVTLMPGAHYFVGESAVNAGKVSLKGLSRVTGTDVTLYFGSTSKLFVTETAKLDLKAPRSGSDAGMLIIGARDNDKDFLFESPSIDRLEGVVYLPAARLVVQGAGQLAEQSKWTITVVKKLRVNQAAQLMVRTDYAGSEVPRPAQVRGTAGPHLIK